jgi:peptide/nickel transport system permease protein
MIPTLFLVSIVSFAIIQLPPGDFLTVYAAELASSGAQVDATTLESLRETYGLGQPVYIQYWKWISRVLQGDFGRSFRWDRPVKDLIWDRLLLTLIVAAISLIFTWVVAIPVGILSAVKQYSIADYVATFLGFLGLAVPEFLLALILMVGAFLLFNQSVGGLFSPEFLEAPWSFARVLDLLKHIWIPMIILGLGHATLFIRILRANLLDELRAPYVTAARAKGLAEHEVLIRYPVRMALNPFVSMVGWRLPDMISGLTIVSIVLSLPTVGPLLLDALISQDMFLAGAFILLLSVMTLFGTLISDILLAWLDPRIRLQYFN